MTVIKTESQIRFSVLAEESGLKQVELAKQLHVTEAKISRYLAGTQNPPQSKLDLLARIVRELKGTIHYPEQGGSMVGMEHPEVKSDAIKLDEIRRADPEKFQVLREVIGITHTTIKKPVSLTAAEKLAVASAPTALKLALHQGPKSSPSPKAGGTISYKRRPKHGTGRHSRKPPEPPTQAPNKS